MKHKGFTVMSLTGLVTIHTSATLGDYWWCDSTGKWLVSTKELIQRLNALVDPSLLTHWNCTPKALITLVEVTTSGSRSCLEVTFVTKFCNGHNGVEDVICIPIQGCVEDVFSAFFEEFNDLHNGNVDLRTKGNITAGSAVRGVLRNHWMEQLSK
jgi:hypothetical protein